MKKTNVSSPNITSCLLFRRKIHSWSWKCRSVPWPSFEITISHSSVNGKKCLPSFLLSPGLVILHSVPFLGLHTIVCPVCLGADNKPSPLRTALHRSPICVHALLWPGKPVIFVSWLPHGPCPEFLEFAWTECLCYSSSLRATRNLYFRIPGTLTLTRTPKLVVVPEWRW